MKINLLVFGIIITVVLYRYLPEYWHFIPLIVTGVGLGVLSALAKKDK